MSKKQCPGDMIETSGPHGAYNLHSTGQPAESQTTLKPLRELVKAGCLIA